MLCLKGGAGYLEAVKQNREACLEGARRVFDVEIEALRGLRERLDETFAKAVELINEAVERRNKVVVLGVGKSGHIGDKIAATLTSTGSPAIVLNSLNALHGDLGIVSDGDVVLALSYSGETEELNNILAALTRFDVRIIAITGNLGSSLAKRADVALDCAVPSEACPLQLAPTSSTTAMLVMGDALAMVLLERRGFGREEFARFHPGGALGRSLLLKVGDIMRTGDALAVLDSQASVMDALRAMSRAKSGAAVITEDSGLLAGIFTHGDFARHFQNNPQLGFEKVSAFMTKNPISIRADKLAVEVLRVLETHRIDDIVVVNDEGCPVGLVDSQDLARHKLV